MGSSFSKLLPVGRSWATGWRARWQRRLWHRLRPDYWEVLAARMVLRLLEEVMRTQTRLTRQCLVPPLPRVGMRKVRRAMRLLLEVGCCDLGYKALLFKGLRNVNRMQTLQVHLVNPSEPGFHFRTSLDHAATYEILENRMDRDSLALTIPSYACQVCGAKAHLRKCAGCKFARYCSEQCQRIHWPYHATDCAHAQRLLPDDARHRMREHQGMSVADVLAVREFS